MTGSGLALPHFYPDMKGLSLNSTPMLEQGMNNLGGDDVPGMSYGIAPMGHLDVPLDIAKSSLSTDFGSPLSLQFHLVIPPYSSPIPVIFHHYTVLDLAIRH